MIKTLVYVPGEGIKEGVPFGNIKEFVDKDSCSIWVDLEEPTEDNFKILADIFNLHPLAIEDAKTKFNLPKIDEHVGYLFIVWHDLLGSSGLDKMETAEVDIFLGKNFFVTVHDRKMKNLDLIFDHCKQAPDFMSRGAEWVLHHLLDVMVDGDFLLVDRISNEVDELEDRIFEVPTQENLKELFLYKRQLITIRKIAAPQREIISVLLRHETFIERHAYIYFQDVADHLIRIVDSVDTARDVISGAMDIYLSNVSNRMNEVMKKLTIVATIFIPLTLITGIYGMNFKNMPELYWTYGYFIVLIVMVSFVFGVFIYFKSKRW
ncbi:magnesium/cobalt transporter CorA [Candidatus Oleimmundimicrobium sp.]|uniref:magnesium/cobalt transporter CorA n=1 Tax=Candidatus Oleimmundimicrobium sp. TaxID=3060597 RepID=UPI0027177D35|nr:magnesium/cobalt transporter CorA [Candidatus Oleimmundimicrobium sp.]MDO8885310.1 magnesium/cobalt transporter CorA [Candidatus Oleimmundimicrobium sp.]